VGFSTNAGHDGLVEDVRRGSIPMVSTASGGRQWPTSSSAAPVVEGDGGGEEDPSIRQQCMEPIKIVLRE
jgi:hypothetical protein